MIYDGSTIDIALELFLEQTKIEYSALPDFISDWNLCKGWEECWDYNGYIVDSNDLNHTLKLLKESNFANYEADIKKLLNSFETMLNKAKENNQCIKIVRG